MAKQPARSSGIVIMINAKYEVFTSSACGQLLPFVLAFEFAHVALTAMLLVEIKVRPDCQAVGFYIFVHGVVRCAETE